MAERLMSTDDLSDYLAVSKETIYRWIRTGHGPKRFKLGVHNRFRRTDVDAWLETRSSGGSKETSEPIAEVA